MKKLGELLKELRGKESLRDAAKRIGISHTYLDTIEKGKDRRSGNIVKPTPETLKLISDAYNYSYEKLMSIAGYIDNKNEVTELTEKDKKDMAKRMEEMKKDLLEANATGDGLSYKGEPMSPDAIDSLLEALEMAERITTLANKKYIPKKYRDND